jgi:hypothetical protein
MALVSLRLASGFKRATRVPSREPFLARVVELTGIRGYDRVKSRQTPFVIVGWLE